VGCADGLQRDEQLLEQRCSDGALIDDEEPMRAAFAVTELVGEWVEVQADAVAVAPGLGGVRGDFWKLVEAGALQGFAEDCLLDGELCGVGGVLIVAAAAGCVEGAGGLHPLGRAGEDVEQSCFGEGAFIAGDGGLDELAGQCARDEDGFAIGACQTGAAVDHFFDLQVHSSARI
jgi:hypothetical protein